MPGSGPLLTALKQHFGFGSFRPLQEEIIGASLAGRDVFALLPTGGGKSLCYQLPALVRGGLTVVVSPLISLMKDQVDGLEASGISATFLNSSIEAGEAQQRTRDLDSGRYSLLYVAPERLMLPAFLAYLKRLPVSAVAIDEAHCISEWGHDFRPEYRQLVQLRQHFPEIPVMALTATATERVREDVLQHLQLREPATYQGSFNRPKLTYRVLPKSGPYQQVLDLVRRRPSESGIVYCQSRRSSEYVAERLNEDGIKARPYHAGLEADERRRHQDLFRRDDVQVICATIAFGMGIDKPNIRFIAHYDLPKSLENYYQETGRAGRDGLPSECLLLYGPGDAVKYSRFIDEKPDAKEREIARQQLAEMEGFAASSECRRRALLRYFGEEFCAENCGACDNCLSPRQMFDATEAARKLLAAVFRIKEKSGFSLGLTHVADVLAGANTEKVRRLGHHELKAHGGGKERSRSEWVAIGRELLRLRYLMQDANRYNVLELTPEGRRLMAGQGSLELPLPQSPSAGPAASKQVLPCDEGLFERLRRLRKTLADQRNVAAYVIFSDVALRQMAREYPANEAEFGRISGVGRSKLSEFGTIFMREIAAYLASNPRQTFTDDVPTVPVRKMRLGDTHRETLRRFGEGQRIEEIAAERGLAASTIWGHLADAAEAGEEIDAGRLLAQGEREQIIAAIDAKGGGNLRGAFEALEERHPYGLLRIVRALCDRGAEGEGATAATNPAEGCASASSRPGRTEASPAKSPASAPSPA